MNNKKYILGEYIHPENVSLFSKGNDFCIHIMKIRLYSFDLLTPHFYIVKLGFTGLYILVLFLLKNIDCGYSLEPPRRGGSYEYPQSMFEQKYEKYQNFLSENFQILEVNFSIYLNRRVFVMDIWFPTINVHVPNLF